jgi:tetratricopeptide (TPR) repeat protein
MPLAIELAAARVRVLSADQIAVAVSDRFRLLTGGPRAAAERQQTLRASVDWSHDLLTDDERRLLRRVAVFGGGFTLDAAEQVCADDGISSDRVLDLLASLADQSLLIADEQDAGVRYRLLETVREYGLERLAVAGEEEAVRGRHRDYFAALADAAAPRLDSADQGAWLERLDPEAANLAAAIETSLRSDPVGAVRFCIALHRWWLARGRFAEAELACSRALGACGEREPAMRARLLSNRAWLAVTTGAHEVASEHASEALALAGEADDRSAAAGAHATLGVAAQFADPAAGRAELTRAFELARAAGDDWAIVTVSQSIALTYMYQHDHARAARSIEEVADLGERLGDSHHITRRWFYLGWIALSDGRFAEARDLLERSAAALERFGDPAAEAYGEICLGLIGVWEGTGERALERLQSQFERSLKLGTGAVIPMLMVAIASADLAAGRFAEARDRLAGLVPLVEGRDAYSAMWSLCMLAEAQRLLADDAAEPTAVRAQALGERIGNALLATRARYTLGRLAAQRGDWPVARRHALAHLDACVEGGHATYLPASVDALAEVAAGLGAARDAVRLFAAAERSRAAIGVVRLPPEDDHWDSVERRLREALGADAYEAARAEGADLTPATLRRYAVP